jgi:hypothetical protein
MRLRVPKPTSMQVKLHLDTRGRPHQDSTYHKTFDLVRFKHRGLAVVPRRQAACRSTKTNPMGAPMNRTQISGLSRAA